MKIRGKLSALILFGLVLCLVSPSHVKPGDTVTCGSVLKLVNTQYRVRLHSHELKYGSGSEQQSVTATEEQGDVNSLWAVRGAVKKPCSRGEPVRCRSVIRLTHLQTGMNLHSHHYSAPMSHHQEVSAYRSDGDDDPADHWEVQCDGDVWRREDEVVLRHVVTDVYLGVSGKRFGRPISGQYEVVGAHWRTDPVVWKAADGVFVHPPEPVRRIGQVEHTEL